jgi:hypothetical protein
MQVYLYGGIMALYRFFETTVHNNSTSLSAASKAFIVQYVLAAALYTGTTNLISVPGSLQVPLQRPLLY